MPLLDASSFRENDAAPMLVAANAAIDRLRTRLVDEIAISIIPDAMVRSMAQAFLQGHVRRALMLIEGGYQAHLARNGLVACVCARAIWETVASVADFCDKLSAHLAEGNFQKTANFLHSSHFTARMAEFTENKDDYRATNVMSQIHRLSKKIPGARREYDRLSERTHPNSLGALHYFWESEDPEDMDGGSVMKFSNDAGHDRVIGSLLKAAYLLTLMEREICLIEIELAKLRLSS